MSGSAPAQDGDRCWLGVHLLTYGATWPEVVEAAVAIDELGYDALLTQDHLFATQGDPAQPFFEAWTTIASLAPITTRIALGHLTGAVPLRHPAVVARMLSTVDHASGGRAMLGLGAAWDEVELSAHGIPTDGGLAGRLDRLDEALAIIDAILRGESVTTDSPFYHLDAVRQRPGPVQAHVPVIIGSAGMRRGLRIAARHADLWQTWISPGGVAGYRRLDAALDDHCSGVGRDPGAIRRVPGLKLIIRDDQADAERAVEELAAIHRWTPAVRAVIEPLLWRGPAAAIAEGLRPYAEAGADGFVVQAVAPYDLESLARFRTEVAPLLVGDGS